MHEPMSSGQAISTPAQVHPSREMGATPAAAPSGFTAVNGKASTPTPSAHASEPAASGANAPADVPDPRGEEGHHGPSAAASREPDPLSTAPPPTASQPAMAPAPAMRPIQSAALSPGKRKRSWTDEGMNRYANSPYDVSPPGRTAPSHQASPDRLPHRGLSAERHQLSSANGAHGADSQGSSSPSDVHEHLDGPPGHHSQSDRGDGGENGRMDPDDVRMAEALQNETRESASQPDWTGGNRVDDESADHYGAYATDRNSQNGGHQASAKRKRVFSNRTKTGCLTCRRRKKKCDETHPFCNNCKRGHFTCEGYSSRSPWQKHAGTKPPVPLQAKDGYVESPDYSHGHGQHHPHGAGHGHGHNHHHHNASPSPRGSRDSAAYDGVQSMRHGALDEADPRAHRVSNSPGVVGQRNGAGPYPSRPWPRNVPYMEGAPPANNPLPPISQITRDPAKQAYSVTPYRDMGRPHSTSQQSSGSWPNYPAEYSQPGSSSAGGGLNTRNLPGVAREGLSMEESAGSMIKGDGDQKERMVKGQLYEFADPVLVDDRQACKIALRKYHDIDNPVLGLKGNDRWRLLTEIFVPYRSKYYSCKTTAGFNNAPALAMSDPAYAESGTPISRDAAIAERMRPGLVIETPFRCHYGYNIHLGEDVYIGDNCSIVDACPVVIGSKTWIGQNVQLVASSAAVELNKRAGSSPKALWVGSRITIAEDVHIGAGAIILQGVTIGRGALIKPGTVVSHNVEQYQTVPS